MSIRSITAAAAISASLALLPQSAQAGQDEEQFVLGALAGAVALVTIGAAATGIDRLRNRGQAAPLAYGPDQASNAHIAYCQQRYRTYRVSDGTFQPNNGPRRLCTSPYAG